MKNYDHKNIDKKWQKYWLDNQVYKTDINSNKEKCYILDMFPYPSGEGLHVGHPKGYIATDIYSRYKKMSGFEVLHPMGFDAFGLPAEQYAIKNKMNPSVSTAKNVARYKEQLENIGLNYDWSREVNTTDPNFYKWTQWIFKQMYKKGLAYQSHEPINWCPSCKTGLANEDLEDGKCERCESVIEKKPIRQWVLKITNYADRMLTDLNNLNWPEHIKEAQRNWIGKSDGAEIDFKIILKHDANDLSLHLEKDAFRVFTTRPDTIFGATYCVLAPEHKIVKDLLMNNLIANTKEVFDYVSTSMSKTEIERSAEGKEKTGVRLDGVFAINPVNKKEIPIYIADYVLANYGTGAIMAVPAHDTRDAEFAKKFNIESVSVVEPMFEQHTGDSAMKPDLEFQYRDVVVVAVKNPKDDNFLTISWKGMNMNGFVTGGLDGDDVETAARKEILEETGYKNLKLNFISKENIHTKFYQRQKNVNRHARWNFAYFDLLDEEKSEIDESENSKHEVVWLNKSKLLQTLSFEESICLAKIIDNDFSFLKEEGVLKNSGQFDGLSSEEAKIKITDFVGGKIVSKYKIKDWVFARQRYWGEPFPIVFDENNQEYIVADSELPVRLPEVDNYEPTGNGESPLASIDSFVNVYGYIDKKNEFVSVDIKDANDLQEKLKLDKYKNLNIKLFKRETNTMPQWAGSSWYYLRYIDNNNLDNLIDKKLENKWLPVDVYVGGDHATRHLIYARFWHKFLYDIGFVHDDEPFKRLEFLGFILAEDGRKMSKRWGNVINPDDVVEKYGADTLRVYEMFMGPFEKTVSWSEASIKGVSRFLDRVVALSDKIIEKESENITHKTIKKVGEDIENFKFNTAVSQLMICINELEEKGLNKEDYKNFIKILSPLAPHVCEEIWQSYFAEKDSIYNTFWPNFDESKLLEEKVKIAVQVNGKLRGVLEVVTDTEEKQIMEELKKQDFYSKYVEGEPKKVIVIKNRVVNVII